jgi:hypothetical protein
MPGQPVSRNLGETLLADWMTRGGEVHSMQGMARVKVKSSGRSVSGSQVVLVAQPARVRAETLSPFGTPLLLLATDGTDLGVLLPTENVYYRGAASAENLARFTRMPLRPEDLVKVLLYKTPILDFSDMEVYGLAAGGWQISLSAGERHQELLFNLSRQLVVARYYQGDALQLQVTYDRFTEDTAGFPQKFVVELPLLETVASLDFNELAINRVFLDGIFRLKQPNGAQVILLDE